MINRLNFKYLNVVAATIAVFATDCAVASTPKFSITPTSSTTIPVRSFRGDLVPVSYNVYNNLSTTKTLTMQKIPGVVQKTNRAGSCKKTFTLPHNGYCRLDLVIDTKDFRLGKNIYEAPMVCIGATKLSCSIPSPENRLRIDIVDIPDAVLTVTAVDLVTGSTATTSGVPVQKKIVITNHGPDAAQDFDVTYGTPPPSTTITDDCLSNFAANTSCTVTIIPGATASGAMFAIPAPTDITIKGNNTNTIHAEATVLGYGSLYEGGYVYAVKPGFNQAKVSGSVVAIADSNPVIDTLQWGAMGVLTGANSTSAGQANTSAMIATLGSVNNDGYRCAQTKTTETGTSCSGTDCLGNWYLPALCEMAFNTTGSVSVTPCPSTNNIASNLPPLYADNCPLGKQQCLTRKYYFSSTQYQDNPYNSAFAVHFVPGDFIDQGQALLDKNTLVNLRCVRKFM